MNSFDKSLSFCVFCLRDSCSSLQIHSINDVDIKFERFIKLFGRYVGKNGDRNTEDTTTFKGLGCCDECVHIVKQFCDIYNQYKCLELQLDGIVWKIERIMRLANKVPSRVYQAKQIMKEFSTHGPDGGNLVKNFRENVLQNCQLKLERTLPRVSLQRYMSQEPAKYEPVFINCSDEAINVTLDSNNEEYKNKAEDENTDNLETGIQTDHDGETDTQITEPTNIENKTDNSERAKSSMEMDTNCMSNATSPLPTDNTVITNMPICKTEPLNDEPIQTENCAKYNKTYSRSANIQVPTTEYNLRRKLPPKTTQQIDDDIDNCVTNNKADLDSVSNLSNSSLSETSSSSESSSSEEDIYDNKPNRSSLPNRKPPGKKFKPKYKYGKHFMCKSGKCWRKFSNKQLYENHLKLHSQGKFTCNFCSKVKPNLAELSSHEYKIHGEAKKPKENGWLCPRCPFKASYLSDYEAHFAHTHFGVGIGPLKRRVFEKCKICNRGIWNIAMDSHFKACHDTTKLDDKKIKRCKEDGCFAYFVQKWQLRNHHKLEHEPETVSNPNELQCQICLKKFSLYIALQRHKRKLHKYQLRDNLSSQPNNTDTNAQVGQTQQVIIQELNQLKCNFCHVVNDTPTALALHEADKHSTKNTVHLKNSKKTSCCPRCPYEYSLKRIYIKHHLHIHQNVLNPESTTACKLCSGGNVYKQNSERHFRNFHKIDDGMEPHKCTKCSAYFRKSFQLQMHTIKIHQQDHKCDACRKLFKTRNTLKIHMRNFHLENGENPDLPLGCDFLAGCKKRFKTQAELDHHKKYGHQRPGWAGPTKDADKFKCDKCEKRFTCHTSLQTHLSKVHGDRPFVCEECGKAFGGKPQLEMHLEFQKGPDEWKWQCAECGKKCATSQKLEVHRRMHTKEKPFVCPFCGVKYAHKHNLRGHLEGKHGNEKGVEEMIGKGKKGNYMKRKGTKRGDCIIALK